MAPLLIFPTAGCHIQTVTRELTGIIDNYQDVPGSPPDINEIKKRAKECRERVGLVDENYGTCCGKYDRLKNNCEETATYIRYGKEGRVSCLVISKITYSII